MPTKLEKTVKREIEIDGEPYTVAISPDGVKLTQKGYRKGQELSWKELKDRGEDEGESASPADMTAGSRAPGAASAASGMTPRSSFGPPESGYR